VIGRNRETDAGNRERNKPVSGYTKKIERNCVRSLAFQAEDQTVNRYKSAGSLAASKR